MRPLRLLLPALALLVAVPATAAPVVGTWAPAAAPATGPGSREYAATAYDSARHETVLFGGATGSYGGDTWVWDGATWTQRFPATSPSPRLGAGMAYDSTRHVVVLFGGYTEDGPVDDTWLWDGTTWTQVATTTQPTPRGLHAMAYDAAHDRVVLYGGGYGFLFDTWLWDGSSWSEVLWVPTPPGREGASMVYDEARGEVVMFGGVGRGDVTSNEYFDETWVWDGAAWTERALAVRPPARFFAAMAYDPVHARTILTTGEGPYSGPYTSPTDTYGDTWSWDGTAWTELHPAVPMTPRHGAAFAPDAAGHLVLFGGRVAYTAGVGDTWTFVSAT